MFKNTKHIVQPSTLSLTNRKRVGNIWAEAETHLKTFQVWNPFGVIPVLLTIALI